MTKTSIYTSKQTIEMTMPKAAMIIGQVLTEDPHWMGTSADLTYRILKALGFKIEC